MQAVRALSNLNVDPLREYLASCEQPFKVSELYATADAARFADTSVRLSESRAIVDPKLTALSEALVLSTITCYAPTSRMSSTRRAASFSGTPTTAAAPPTSSRSTPF